MNQQLRSVEALYGNLLYFFNYKSLHVIFKYNIKVFYFSADFLTTRILQHAQMTHLLKYGTLEK